MHTEKQTDKNTDRQTIERNFSIKHYTSINFKKLNVRDLYKNTLTLVSIPTIFMT